MKQFPLIGKKEVYVDIVFGEVEVQCYALDWTTGKLTLKEFINGFMFLFAFKYFQLNKL